MHVVPTGRFKVGKRIVVRDSFDVRLSEDGTATVDVTPTDNTFAWKVSEFPDDTNSSFERVVQVPAPPALSSIRRWSMWTRVLWLRRLTLVRL